MSTSVGLTQSRAELSLDEVAAKYPDVPRLVIVKTDVHRRGIHYAERALAALDTEKHQIAGTHIFGARDGKLGVRPESVILRDGTSIITTPTPLDLDPYVVDVVDDRLVLVDKGQVVEEVEYWPRPDFSALHTASGTEIRFVVSARPMRLSIFPYRYCFFWNDNQGCLFCDIVPQHKHAKEKWGVPVRAKPEEIGEAVGAALQEPGRFTGICLTGGSVIGGENAFDAEVDYYVKVLQAIGKNFRDRKFPSQLISTAFSKQQLQRLYDETGLTSYTADIEVLDEALFNWLCPGKARWVGYQEWKRRLVDAVDVFGPGQVDTGIVAGIEQACPHGFTSEDQALEATVAEAEDLARQGVPTQFVVWSPRPGAALGIQKNASLEYYIRLARELHGLRVKYKLSVEFDDFRNCGNHPDTDLSRLL